VLSAVDKKRPHFAIGICIINMLGVLWFIDVQIGMTRSDYTSNVRLVTCLRLRDFDISEALKPQSLTRPHEHDTLVRHSTETYILVELDYLHLLAVRLIFIC
jgi:hypothetical protein